MCFEIRRKPLKVFAHSSSATLSDKAKLKVKEASYKGAKGDLSSLCNLCNISSKPSLVQLPSSMLSSPSKSMDYEDTMIPLKLPANTTSPSTESEASFTPSVGLSLSPRCFDENLADTLFANLSSLDHYEEKYLVDMEDDEITELWNNEHGPKQTKAEVKKVNIVENEKSMIGGGVRGTRPQLLFKRNPVQCVFVAKSA
jgi:hypothetical protein